MLHDKAWQVATPYVPNDPPAIEQNKTTEADQIDLDKEVEKLAALPLGEYERCRKEEANRLGVRRSILDKLVAPFRETKSGQGGEFKLVDPEPWDSPINGAELLNDLRAAFCRYVALPDGAAEVLPLWALHAYVFRAFPVSPKLHIKSPEKQCGKTLLLDVLQKLTPRSIRTENLSTAALFRLIDAQAPTVLVDEADQFLSQNDELVGIVNSGHRADGCVIRCVGDQHELKRFETFGPLALAGIGGLPGTIEDRSISIPMRRKRANDQVSNFRSDCADDLNILARKAARWAADNYENLSHDPEIPAGLFNRVADNWRVLLAIADCAGGEWPERARKVAVSLSERKDDDSIRIKLIGAVRDIFIERGLERMASAEICEALVAIEDGPWKEWRRGQPITATQLSHQLAHHEIKSRQIKFSGMNKRGFSFDQINDVFTRYTPNQSATPLPCPETMAYSPNQSATPENKVALQNPLKPALSNEGSRVALPDPEYGELKCEKGIFEL